MTTYSLQDVIDVENELQSAIRIEKKKCALWLEKQKNELLIAHNRELKLLQKKLDKNGRKIKTDTEAKAKEKIGRAKEKADRLRQVNDKLIQTCLKKHLFRVITGGIP